MQHEILSHEFEHSCSYRGCGRVSVFHACCSAGQGKCLEASLLLYKRGTAEVLLGFAGSQEGNATHTGRPSRPKRILQQPFWSQRGDETRRHCPVSVWRQAKPRWAEVQLA